MFQTTLNLTTDSERKQLNVSKSTYEYIKNKTNQYNKTCTKGIFCYELILTVENDRYSNYDNIDELEELINNKLEKHTSSSFINDLDNIKYSDNRRKRINTNTKDINYSLNLYIPSKIDDKLFPEWGANKYVMQKVTEFKITPYNCRKHRINVKKDIISFIESNKSPDHEISEYIINNKNSKYDIKEIHNKLMDYNKIDIDNLKTIEQYDQIEDELKISEKYDAIGNIVEYNCVNNKNIEPRNMIDDLLKEKLDISTESYRKKKVNLIIDKYELDKYDNEETIIQKTIENDNMRVAINRTVSTLLHNKDNKEKIHQSEVISLINNKTTQKYNREDIIDCIDEYENKMFGFQVILDNGEKYIKPPK